MKRESPVEKILSSGNFFKNQFLCGNSLIAWSHSSRFRTARKLMQPYARGKRLLDYGCGDGTFIAMNLDLFSSAVGVDANEDQIRVNRSRFAELPQTSFLGIGEIDAPGNQGGYQIISCMETIEHCTEEESALLFRNLKALLSPGGMLMISVPVEIGPSLILKQIARRVASLRRLGDYKYTEGYAWSELKRMLFASERTEIDRPRYEFKSNTERTVFYHGHKGFNWKRLRERLSQDFKIERTVFSPLPVLGEWINSQVFFLAVRR